MVLLNCACTSDENRPVCQKRGRAGKQFVPYATRLFYLNKERERRIYASAPPSCESHRNRPEGMPRRKQANGTAGTKPRRFRSNMLRFGKKSAAADAVVSCRLKLKRKSGAIPFSGILFRPPNGSFRRTGPGRWPAMLLCETPFRGSETLTKKLPGGSFLWCG